MKKVVSFCKSGLLWCMILLLGACGKDNSCSPVAKLADYDTSECTLCSIFKVVFNTVSSIAADANRVFTQPVIILTSVGFAVWLAVFVLRYLATMETRDIKDVFQELLVKGFQVVLVVVILNFGANRFYEWLINPVYLTVLKAAETASDGGIPNGNEYIDTIDTSGIKSFPGGLPADMGKAILKTMTSIENNVLQIKAFGSSLTCYSWEKRFLGIIPNFSLLLSGGFFWLLATAMIIILPFLMIDAVFQLGVALALLVPAIGGYPFRATKIYSKKVWDIFLNSAFTFLFVSIVALLMVSVLQSTAESVATEANMTWTDIMSDDEGKIDEYIDKFGWFHNNMLKFAMVFLLAWTVMSMGRKFADEFASSIAGTSIGSSIGTMAASATKGAVKKLGKPAGQVISDKVEKQAASMGQHLAHFHRRKVDSRQQKRFDRDFVRYGGKTGDDADGNTIASYTRNRRALGLSLPGFLGKVTVTRDADGNISKEKGPGFVKKAWSKVKNVFTRKKSDGSKLKDVVTTKRYERMDTGNYVTERVVKVTKGKKVLDSGDWEEFLTEKTVSEKVLAKSQEAEKILTEKGELDEIKIQKMMYGLNDKQKEQLQEQIADRLLFASWSSYDGIIGKKIVTERDGDIVRKIVTLPGGRKEISEIKFPRGNALTTEDKKAALAEITGASKVYNGDDLQKYMDTAQKALDDPNRAVDFANIRKSAEEDLQKFVKGDLVISDDAYGKMAKFIDTFAGGDENQEMKKLHSDAMAKLDDVVKNQEGMMPKRIVMTKVIIRQNGHVTKLSSDGLYDRIDDFRIFNEDDSRLERGAKRLARGIPGYHLADNMVNRYEIGKMNSIADVEARAVRDVNGQIKMNTIMQEGRYYSGVDDPYAESVILPEGRSVNKFFHFTGLISGKEYGTFGEMNRNGEFIDKSTGEVIAQKKFEVDEQGNRYQVYLSALGDEYTVRTNSEGKSVKVTKNEDGSLEWGKEVTREPKRELVVKYEKNENGSIVEKRMMLKDGMLSDVNGMRVYGSFEKSNMARSYEDKARFNNYFK